MVRASVEALKSWLPLLLGIWSHTAFAAGPTVDVRNVRPSGDPRATLATEPVQPFGHFAWSLNLPMTYDYRTVRLVRGHETLNLVEHALVVTPGFALGLGARSMLALSLPFLLQSGDDAPAWAASRSASGASFGDLRLVGKHVVREQTELGGLGIALLSALTFPTGTSESYIAERGATATLHAVFDYSLLIAGAQMSVGYMVRGRQTIWPDAPGERAVFGNMMPFALGLWVKPSLFKLDDESRQRWEIGVRGALPMGPVFPFGAGAAGSAATTQMALTFSDRFELGKDRDAYVLVGAEVPLYAGVGVPALRGVVSVGYHHRSHDRDGDGIDDAMDECPDVAEDRDGVQDADGCPDIDDDEDGIVDRKDLCPRTPGVASERGCPPKDSDGDGIPDKLDACPKTRGIGNEDTGCNGCPITDRDSDGIEDSEDACPEVPGTDKGCPPKDSP